MASLGVVGDLMLDVVTHVPDADVDELIRASHAHAPIRSLCGGTALLAARAGVAAGFHRVLVLGAVGADQEGRLDAAAGRIAEELQALGAEAHLKPIRGAPTGTAILATFREDRRLLISSPGANLGLGLAALDPEDLNAIAGCDLAWFSGYSLLQPARAEAVLALMAACRARGGRVALDLVPHRLETRTSALERALEHVDAVVSEAATARRIWASDLDVSRPDAVEALAERIGRHHRVVLLRAGVERELLLVDGQRRWLETAYQHAPPEARRGYLDQLAVRHLHAWLADT